MTDPSTIEFLMPKSTKAHGIKYKSDNEN